MMILDEVTKPRQMKPLKMHGPKEKRNYWAVWNSCELTLPIFILKVTILFYSVPFFILSVSVSLKKNNVIIYSMS